MASLRPSAVICVLAILLAPGGRSASARAGLSTIAVFPIENLTGRAVPADAIHQFMTDGLSSAGFRVLASDALDDFMVRHRVRYAAGIDAPTAALLKEEAGVDGVLIVSVELSDPTIPPKIALTVRLVSLDAPPAVIWADDAGLAGDDAPGLFELGLVNDYDTLQARALEHLMRSLVSFLKTGNAATSPAPSSKFRPRSVYRVPPADPAASSSIAVLPFYNVSGRRNAGDIVTLLFMRHLAALPRFRIVDTGVTRQELLNARVIMDGGVSIADADTVASLVDANYVLAGRVISYQDFEGPSGKTLVEFSTVLIEKTSRRVVFSSDSDNRGDDGVHFFERGMSRTAHLMATQMVRHTIEAMVGDAR